MRETDKEKIEWDRERERDRDTKTQEKRDDEVTVRYKVGAAAIGSGREDTVGERERTKEPVAAKEEFLF